MLNLLDEINKNPGVENALNLILPNSSEETDYDGWVEGSKKFADDNYDLLKEWIE